MLGVNKNLLLLVVLALCALFAVGAIWRVATERGELKQAVTDANDATGSVTANRDALDGSARASDQHARDAIALHGEANAGREEIARARNTPAAPGTVGADARIDPGLGQRVLCRIERVRHDPVTEPCRSASVSDQ